VLRALCHLRDNLVEDLATPAAENSKLTRMHGALPRAGLLLFAAALWAAVPAAQGSRVPTLESIYDPGQLVEYSGTSAPDLTWIDDETYLVATRGGSGGEWRRVDAATGRSSPFIDLSALERAVASDPGISRDQARQFARPGSLTLNPARSGALLTIAEDLYVFDFGTARLTRLTSAAGAEEEATFSPDGRSVAFVRANNLYVVDVAGARERALTSDGHDQLLNGKLDWLYQEEIYGRGRFRAYWWSPDSARIAFLQLDERPVPEYTVVDHLPYRPALEVTDYPKAGDPNPLVKLGVAPISGDAPVWVSLTEYDPENLLIVNVDWTPDSRSVVHQVQDREQTWLDVRLADPTTGRSRRLLRETTSAWVSENGNPVWLEDGSFLWMSERSGFRHVYRVSPGSNADTAVEPSVRAITQGAWEVRAFHGVDRKRGELYYAAGARDHLSTDIYRVALDGSGVTRLSSGDGTHRARFSPGFSYYVDTWSDVLMPPQVRLHDRSGREVRVIHGNDARSLREHRIVGPEFVQVRARDGFVLDGMLIKPPDFDAARRYPVYQLTYAGPGAAQVRRDWGGSQFMFHQVLARQGVLVWVLDNRSASGKGAEAQWPIYGRLGEMELQDLEDGAAWLARQPYVDASRMVLSGWSYGGFMTTYALTHSTRWSAGIAGAPVTDWRDYDTIYTERYMKLPANNADGYRRTAPRFAAERLHGRLLLLHGTMDDNVHVQNTLQMAYALQRAGKSFEMMLYPRSRHGISDPRLNLHLRQLMLDFVLRNVR
jgi:dipeptidyl-peptidase-4